MQALSAEQKAELRGMIFETSGAPSDHMSKTFDIESSSLAIEQYNADSKIDTSTWLSDAEIAAYRDINKQPLLGLRWNGHEYVEITDATVSEQREYLERIMIPEVARKMFSQQHLTPDAMEEMSPLTISALQEFMEKSANSAEITKAAEAARP